MNSLISNPPLAKSLSLWLVMVVNKFFFISSNEEKLHGTKKSELKETD